MIKTTNVSAIDQRVATWKQSVDQAVGGLCTQVGSREHFAGQIRRFCSYGMEFTKLQASGLTLQRKRHDADNRDNQYFYLIYQRDGSARVQQRHSHATMQRGDLVLLDSNQPFSIEYGEHGYQYCFHIPREMALRNWRHTRVLTAEKVSAKSDLAALVTPLLQKTAVVGRTDPTGASEDCLLNAVLSLMQPLFTQTRDRAKEYHSIYLQKAMAFIEHNLRNEAITGQMVADHLGISPRHLQRIFKTLGTSFNKLLREHRLCACASDLADPRLAHIDVTSVAFYWGFKDCAHFSRVFKDHYGLPPSQYRAQHLTGR
ncbi:transcriptional regulator FeaR [Marinobacter mobilis]|uniref:AraC-type DNA-binding protein n=1 Tax=Marinobacter mobilis TaxID=488533 RepID=A0A1H2WPF8_9GAMM|nr:transcriptional regulator FeaR [Marinobacter mobilis]SDW81879.1 AraC-type DNA-binding protein [Marinobacter mobilis]